MRERQVREWQVKNESVETQDRDNVFTLRVFPGDASTPPPLLDPALQSLASGSPLSRTDLTGGSTLLLSCQTQPFVVSVYAAPGGGRNEAKPMDDATRERYREAAKEMFYHSYDSYLQHAFPPHRVRKGPVSRGPVREQT